MEPLKMGYPRDSWGYGREDRVTWLVFRDEGNCLPASQAPGLAGLKVVLYSKNL